MLILFLYIYLHGLFLEKWQYNCIYIKTLSALQSRIICHIVLIQTSAYMSLNVHFRTQLVRPFWTYSTPVTSTIYISTNGFICVYPPFKTIEWSPPPMLVTSPKRNPQYLHGASQTLLLFGIYCANMHKDFCEHNV